MGRIIIPSEEDVPRTADVVVIGGGILGTATAFYASRAGLKTLMVEKRDGLATLTTTASEECFRAQFTEPENVAMMKASIEVFEHFAEHIGIPGYDISLHQQGYLFLTNRPDGPVTLRRLVERYRQAGLDDVRPVFRHGAVYRIRGRLYGRNLPILIASYHPSRQNTQTGRLTQAMLDRIFLKASRIVDGQSYWPCPAMFP